MMRCLSKRCRALLLLPLLVGLACNFQSLTPAMPSAGETTGSSPAVVSADDESIGGQSPDEPTPDLSGLPQIVPPPEGEIPQPNQEPGGHARLLQNFPSSDELPETFGKDRRQPYALHTLVRTSNWDFQVLELLRGKPALELLQSQSPAILPPPPGKEYLLVRVWVRCKIAAEGDWDFSLFDLYLTGSRGLAYTDFTWDIPAPELYYREIYSGMEMQGWLDFLIDRDESGLLLVVDKTDTGAPGGDQHTRFFVAVDDVIATATPDVAPPSQPNGLGVDPGAPLPFGQTAVTSNWQITLLESLRGEAALSLLKERHPNNPEPEAGMEYIAFRARLRSLSQQDQVFWLSNDHFAALDSAGQTYRCDSIFTDTAQVTAWLRGGMFPGSELEGWGFAPLPVSESKPLLVFAPDGLSGKERVYLVP